MKSTDPLMGAKLKSKAHLQLASKFAKSANMTPKKKFRKKIKQDIKKRRISR
jgi:hypothetical protein